MKKIFRAAGAMLMLLLVNVASGQDTISDSVPLDSFFITREPVETGGISIPPQTGPTKIIFYGKEISDTRYLEIKPNGDIFYKPSAFCDCDKCKAYKGMKFLTNFLK